MQATDVTNAASAVSQTTSSAAATAALSSDFDTFIQLLTTQVTNQDPLEPLDSTQFVEQLATFSGLEQQIASNSHLESIVSLLQSNIGLGGDLIGQTIATPAITAEGPFDPVVISSPDVTEGALIVRNSSGDEIFRGASASEWSWDGRDAEGNAVALDTFTFEISGPDGDVPANALGQIDRVIATAGGQAVGIGGNVVTSVYTVL